FIPFVVFDGFPWPNLNILIDKLLYVNIFWGLVNLLPIFPLDGGQIAMELTMRLNPYDGTRQALWLSVVTAAAVAVAGAAALHSIFMALFFGYLAYTSYDALQRMRGRGSGGRGPW